MQFDVRMTAAVVILLMGGLGHFLFVRYLEAAGETQTVHLRGRLTNFPERLGDDWIGTEIEADMDLEYANEHLYRKYKNSRTQQEVTVWMVYSEIGEDRGHHPDVCMAVAGRVQDPSANRTVAGDNRHKEPIQQYRFIDPKTNGKQLVFYWHYTLEHQDRSKPLSELQQRYRRLHKRPSSMTVEVFAPESIEAHGDAAREFVVELDQALQPFVGDHAERGSRRMPVMVVEEGARQDRNAMRKEE